MEITYTIKKSLISTIDVRLNTVVFHMKEIKPKKKKKSKKKNHTINTNK